MIHASDWVCRNTVAMRMIASCVLCFTTISVTACGELEPMVEPEVVDLQLTIDTLKTQVRDAQRDMTELRAELEGRRQELAESQVARAQLEGRVREAERRVAEARHVIDLQREELVAARTERERITRSRLQLQSQIKQLQKHLSKFSMSGEGGQETAPASYDGSTRKAQKSAVGPIPAEAPPAVSQLSARVASTPAALVAGRPSGGASSEHNGQRVRAVSVKPGDTLWSIAHTYQVDLHQLRSLNHLADNKIVVGQAIWVPADRTGGDAAPGEAAINP